MSRGNPTVRRPKNLHTKPLIFRHAEIRVHREVGMPCETAEALDRYVAWAAEKVGADVQEAMTLTMDQALRRFFQRDKLSVGRDPGSDIKIDDSTVSRHHAEIVHTDRVVVNGDKAVAEYFLQVLDLALAVFA